jgi:hypothetical protein
VLVQHRIYFSLRSDDLNPDQISEAVGISPDSEMWKGSRDGEIPRANGWYVEPSLNPDLIGCDVLEEAAAAIVLRLAPYVDRIRSLVDTGAVRATLQYVRTFTPGELVHSSIGTGLDSEAIAFLAAAGANLDIDEYDEVDDTEPPEITDEDGNVFTRLK